AFACSDPGAGNDTSTGGTGTGTGGGAAGTTPVSSMSGSSTTSGGSGGGGGGPGGMTKGCNAATWPMTKDNNTIMVNGASRTYNLKVPDGYDSKKPYR